MTRDPRTDPLAGVEPGPFRKRTGAIRRQGPDGHFVWVFVLACRHRKQLSRRPRFPVQGRSRCRVCVTAPREAPKK